MAPEVRLHWMRFALLCGAARHRKAMYRTARQLIASGVNEPLQLSRLVNKIPTRGDFDVDKRHIKPSKSTAA